MPPPRDNIENPAPNKKGRNIRLIGVAGQEPIIHRCRLQPSEVFLGHDRHKAYGLKKGEEFL